MCHNFAVSAMVGNEWEEQAMQQRVYRGNVSPQDLADFLVQHYASQPNVQAQRLGQENSVLVQIGYGDRLEKMRHAVTVAIAGTQDEAGITVTMGQRQWITPEEAEHAAFWGVLFALLFPLSEAISSTTLPGDIWSQIETFAVSQGAVQVESQPLTHPHLV
jgi:VCBS repeat-containing protein